MLSFMCFFYQFGWQHQQCWPVSCTLLSTPGVQINCLAMILSLWKRFLYLSTVDSQLNSIMFQKNNCLSISHFGWLIITNTVCIVDTCFNTVWIHVWVWPFHIIPAFITRKGEMDVTSWVKQVEVAINLCFNVFYRLTVSDWIKFGFFLLGLLTLYFFGIRSKSPNRLVSKADTFGLFHQVK